jgi:hypothetical protein
MEASGVEGDGKEFGAVVTKLPPPNRFALMYLVGFLRRMQGAADKTMMTIDNLAMVFAPNVVNMSGDPLAISQQTSAAKTFLMTLVAHLNVSLVYSD